VTVARLGGVLQQTGSICVGFSAVLTAIGNCRACQTNSAPRWVEQGGADIYEVRDALTFWGGQGLGAANCPSSGLATCGMTLEMGFWSSNVMGGIVRWSVATAIGAFFTVYQISPENLVATFVRNPPTWTTNSVARLVSLLLGGLIVTAVLNWPRLSSSPLDRERRALVDQAFQSLTSELLEWVIKHHAGGRPPSEFGETLNALRLIDRDYVGWTEIKHELKPFVAENVRSRQSLLFRARKKLQAMTAFQIVVGCLAASILFSATALAVFLREHIRKTSDAAETRRIAPIIQQGSADIASAPVARLAALGWAVQQQKDGYLFSASNQLPDMKEAAAYFRQLDKPFQLQLQSLKNLDGLHFLSDVTGCSQVGISAGSFTDAGELGGFTNLKVLHLSQTPSNSRDAFDASSLRALINLTDLNLYSTRTRSAEFLSGMTKLETLYLRDTLISDLSPIDGLTSLRSVDVTGTRVTDLRPLRHSLLLSELGVGANQMASLGSLSHLDKLKDLRIIEQGEIDLSQVASLASLERMMLWGPRKVDLLPVRQLSGLQSLHLSGLGFGQLSIVANVEAIGDLAELRSLTLGSLAIQNLDFIAKLTRLEELNLNELPIVSLVSLKGLKSLRKISLVGVPVVDISPLLELTNLAELNIIRSPARSDLITVLERRGVRVTVN
jgi:Leucine-rich repeat (LRR) protein